MTNLIPSVDRFLPSTLGFDRMFDVLDHAADIVNNTNTAFPPVNVINVDGYNYIVELAVAGYREEEIEISTEKQILKVTGKKAERTDNDDRHYIVKGIAGRSFSRQFILADTVFVRDATLENGILSIKLENVIPEEQKPRKIVINSDKIVSKKD